MAQGFNELAGGLLTGFVGSKNKSREMALNEEYKKILMDENKAKSKLYEHQVNKLAIEGDLLKWAMGGDTSSGVGQPQPQPQAMPQAQLPPQAQINPMQGLPQAKQPLPEMMAGMQNPLAPTGGQAPPIGIGSEKAAQILGGGAIAAPAAAFGGLQPNIVDRVSTLAQEYFQATGEPLKITDAYRTYEQQADVRRRKPTLALPAGTSQHEKGLAIDIDPRQADFLAKNGMLQKYGFTQPALSKGENYHLELDPKAVQVQQTQTMTQPQVQMPQMQGRGGLTREKFLEGYLDKNFGIKPDEVKDVRYGDHTMIIDKRKGTPLFIIAGQGKTEMVDTTMPDGSVIKRPVVIPPSPLPGGIPVINTAGQPAGGSALGGPMMTKPPQYEYRKVKTPDNKEIDVARPIAQPGVPPLETEPPGLKIGDVGKVQQIMNASDRLAEVNNLVFPDGKLNRTLLFKAATPAAGIGEGTKLQSKMYQVIDAALRLETGAQATPGEIEVKMKEFWPSAKDTEAVIREKLKDLNQYIGRLKKLQDPTGEIGQMGGVKIQIPKGGLNQKSKTWDELKKGLVGGQ